MLEDTKYTTINLLILDTRKFNFSTAFITFITSTLRTDCEDKTEIN
jgi:hypothetical protein